MSIPLVRLETVAEHLEVDPRVLARYEQLGFIQSVREADAVGFRPEEVRRIWTIVSFQRDLGVNLAGVEVILRLRERMDALHRQVADFASDLQAALKDEDEDHPDDAG
jgi:MerR family transcriptional regulator/heat shock protein HspR